MDDHPLGTFLLGLAGLLSMLTGVITHFQEQVEWGVRILTMLAGLGVSVLSGLMLLRKWRRPRRRTKR